MKCYYKDVQKSRKVKEGDSVEMMGHSMCSISTLKSNPMKVFKRAADESAVYVLRRSQPVAVVVSVEEYENLVRLKQELEAKVHESNAQSSQS